jgi:hypothetical protein
MDKAEELLALAYTNTDDLAGVIASVDPNGLEHSIAHGDFTVDNDGIDNDLDGEVDEGGEADIVTIAWFVLNESPDPDTKTIRITINHRLNESPDPDTKTIRITINHRVTLGRDREVNLEFFKANF